MPCPHISTLNYYTIYSFILYTPLLICSFIYPIDQNNHECMNTTLENQNLKNLTLNLWFKVYSYILCGFLGGLIVASLIFYSPCPKSKICMIVSGIGLMAWFSIFQLTWNIIGGYMFWSGLQLKCSSISNYLYSHFIINFITIPVNFIVIHIFKGNNFQQANNDISIDSGKAVSHQQ